MNLNIKKTYLLINRVGHETPSQILEEVGKLNLNLLQIIPEDDHIIDHELKWIPMLKLEESSPSVTKIKEALAKILV